jgi:hypothetical protein
MRIFFALVLFFITANANTQVSISASAGINSNVVRFKNPQDVSAGKFNGNTGWQAGINIQYSLKHWFFFSAPGVEKNNFQIDYNYIGQDALLYYHPLYVVLPVGVGYKCIINKNLVVNLFSGVYGSLGVGGKIKKYLTGCGDIISCPENTPLTVVKANVNYGSDTYDDLAKTKLGIQFGTGINIWKKMGLSCIYNAGLNNIYPAAFKSPRLIINTWQLNANFNIKTFSYR